MKIEKRELQIPVTSLKKDLYLVKFGFDDFSNMKIEKRKLQFSVIGCTKNNITNPNKGKIYYKLLK